MRAEGRPAPSLRARLRRAPPLSLAGGTSAGVAIFLLIVQLTGAIVFDAAYVEDRIGRILSAAGGSWRCELDDAAVSLLGRSLRLTGLRLVGRPRPSASTAAPPGGGDSILVRRVELEGMDWIALLAGRGVRAGSVRLTAPHARLVWSPERYARWKRDARSWLPGARLGAVHITGGTLLMEPAPGSRAGSLSVGLGPVRLGDVVVDSRADRDTARILFARDVDVSVLGAGWRSADGLAAVAGGPLRISSTDSLLVAEGIRLGPLVPDATYFRAVPFRRDRRRLSAGRVEARSLDLRRLVREGAIVARAVDLDAFEVDVVNNRRIPARSESAGRARAWHRLRFGRRICLDTIRLRGAVRYAELHEEASVHGWVSFERLAATAYHVANDGCGASVSEPAVVDARTWIYGRSPAHASFRVPLVSPVFRLSFQGGLGETRVEDFNALSVPLEGLRIESGALDSLWFRVQVVGDTASGEAGGIYRDFSVRFVDRDSGEGGLFRDIKSFFVNSLVIEGSNEPRERDSLRVGTVGHRIEPEDTIFELLWKSLRSGLLDLGGM